MNFTEVTAALTPEQAKAQLPIPFVLEWAGHGVEQRSDGFGAICPFHEDTDPSLDVYGEDLERWGCFPCGKGGDVLDLISELWPGIKGFSETMATAEEMIALVEYTRWAGPRKGVGRRPFDADAAGRRLADLSDLAPVNAFLLERHQRGQAGLDSVDSRWLADQWGVGGLHDQVVVPYRNRDGNLVAYKTRKPGDPFFRSAPGSDLKGVLYGEDRDSEATSVILCEGETDTWAASAALPGYTALGLPTGAGTAPDAYSLAPFKGRKVALAFDGDDAGREATRRWLKVLAEHGIETSVVPVPDGLDLAKISDIPALVARSRKLLSPLPGLTFERFSYQRGEKQLTNWAFHPARELHGDEGQAYEGRVEPQGVDTVLAVWDFDAKSRATRWANRHGGSWAGSDIDAQTVLSQLQAEGPFLPQGRMASSIGLHDGHFVLPDDSIGPEYWRYVPRGADVGWEMLPNVPSKAPETLSKLVSLHTGGVIAPILSWLAVAPLKSLLPQFPALGVTGASGAGKTTLLRSVVAHFTGTCMEQTLTATTKYAMFALIGSTNAVPVWFDEYRPGARKDTKEAFDQTIRDAYTSQSSAKGGMGERWSDLTQIRASAPLIISGEDAFQETSHRERVIDLYLPPDGKNPDALADLPAPGSTFAREYLQFLQEQIAGGWAPEVTPAGPPSLPPRQRFNIGALHLGWGLLQDFVGFALDLGDPDFSLVTDAATSASAEGTGPVEEALAWALETVTCDAVCMHDGQIAVRPTDLVQQITSNTDIKLPGGTRAVKKYLLANLGGHEARVNVMGQRSRAVLVPLDRIE